jgi:hypothetical protein
MNRWRPKKFNSSEDAHRFMESARWELSPSILWHGRDCNANNFFHSTSDCYFPLFWMALNAGVDGSVLEARSDQKENQPSVNLILDGCSANSEAEAPAILRSSLFNMKPATGNPIISHSCNASTTRTFKANNASLMPYPPHKHHNRICFRELWIGASSRSVTRDSRYGNMRAMRIHPPRNDENCHLTHMQEWSAYTKRLSSPSTKAFIGNSLKNAWDNNSTLPIRHTVAFCNRPKDRNRRIADGALEALRLMAENISNQTSNKQRVIIDEFEFHTVSPAETALRLSNVSVLVTGAGAGTFNSIYLQPGSATVVVFQAGTAQCHWHQFMKWIADFGVYPVACTPDTPQSRVKYNKCFDKGVAGDKLHHVKGGQRSGYTINIEGKDVEACVRFALDAVEQKLVWNSNTSKVLIPTASNYSYTFPLMQPEDVFAPIKYAPSWKPSTIKNMWQNLVPTPNSFEDAFCRGENDHMNCPRVVTGPPCALDGTFYLKYDPLKNIYKEINKKGKSTGRVENDTHESQDSFTLNSAHHLPMKPRRKRSPKAHTKPKTRSSGVNRRY